MTDTIYAWSETASSNASADATINWAEFQTPSSVNDSARAMMARIAALVSDLAPNRTSTGTGNAYLVDSDAAGSAHRAGEQITFIPDRSNTGACTLNVDGRGAKAWRPAPGVDFAANNILSGVPVTAYYRSLTDEWLSPGTGYYVSNSAAGVSLQTITARLPQIGDMVISFSPTPGSGRIRLTETTQTVLKSAYPELNSYLSGLSYPWGSTATTFSLPPAAGYYLRFAATTSSVDTSGARTAGSTQSDQNKAHTHTVSTTVTGTTNTTGAHAHTVGTSNPLNASSGASGNLAPGGLNTGATTTSNGDHSHTVTGTGTGTAASDGGAEVRVKNVAFHVDIVASTALSATQVAVFGFPYQWDTGVTAADPGTARVRGNNATLASITALYISKTDGWGVDLSGILSTWDGGTFVSLSKVGGQANRIVAEVSGAATAVGNYYAVPVTVVASAGTLSSNDQLAMEFSRGGVDGVTVPDISGLTEDTTPDLHADYVITYDTSAGAHKKVKIDRLNFQVTAEQYGCVGDGATHDATNLQAALNAVRDAGGGKVMAFKKYYLDANITIPDNVTLEGALEYGMEFDVTTATNYYAVNSQLRLAAGVTIVMDGASCCRNMLVIRDGLSIPATNHAQRQTLIGQFTGTAFYSRTGYQVSLDNILALGHTQITDFQGQGGVQQGRVTCRNVRGDNTNGILIDSAGDVCRVAGCHMYPFLTFTPTGDTVTSISIASPAVVTMPYTHNLAGGEVIVFTTTGSLPTGITAGQEYFVLATGLTSTTFRFSASSGGAAVNTSGTQSGTHTILFAGDHMRTGYGFFCQNVNDWHDYTDNFVFGYAYGYCAANTNAIQVGGSLITYTNCKADHPAGSLQSPNPCFYFPNVYGGSNGGSESIRIYGPVVHGWATGVFWQTERPAGNDTLLVHGGELICTTGIDVSKGYLLADGNLFISNTTAINLQSGCTGAKIGMTNRYVSCTSDLTNNTAATVEVGASVSGASPTFTTIELGASDTTLARAAAGRVTVEGREIEIRDLYSVSVDHPQFGAVGDAVATDGGAAGTDDTAAFQAAIDYVYGLGGGEVTFSKRYLINSDLTIKRGVRLRGKLTRPGYLPPTVGASYGDVAGVLFLNSTASITINQAAAFTNAIVIRKGLILPLATDLAGTTAIAAFAGTAVKMADHGAEADSLLILGFAQALTTDATADPSRIKITQVHFDCTSGILVDGNYDISEVRANRGWPYTTAHLSNTTFTRSGSAFSTGEQYDWGKFSECFSYGYAYGFNILAAADVTIDGCGSDYVPGVTSTSIGIYFGAGTLKGTVRGYQAAAQGRGVVVENGLSSSQDGNVIISDSTFWGQDDCAIDVITGRATITTCGIRGGTLGIRAASGAGVLTITENEFDNVTTPLSINATPLALAGTAIHSNKTNNTTNPAANDRLALRGSTATTSPLEVFNSADSASVYVGRKRGLRATPAANDLLYETWELADSAGNTTIALRQNVRLTTVTDGAEAAQVYWGIMKAGTLTDSLLFTPATLAPVSNDLMALGASTLSWADLFLASGGVINFNNGNATLTHSAGNLTSSVPLTATAFIPSSTTVPTNGVYLPAANTLGWAVNSAAEMQLTSSALSPAVSDGNALGTTSLMWADLFLASGGVVNFNNGNYTLTHSSALLTTSGDFTVTGRMTSTTINSSGTTYDSTTSPNAQVASLESIGANPTFIWKNTSGAADNKYADMFVSTTGITMRLLNDAFNSAGNVLAVTRSGNTITTFDIGGNAVRFPSITTTASAANAFLDNAASNSLLRSTSSIAYKTDVEDLSPDYARRVLDLRPVWYRSTAAADRKDWSWYGYIAEEVASVDPRLVHWSYPESAYDHVEVVGEDGVASTERRLKPGAEKVPDGVQYERIAVLQGAIIKDLLTRVEALERAKT